MNCSTLSKTTWSDLSALIAAHDAILISSHVNPDGDCLGSQIAFAWYCRSLGKKVAIYNRDPVPQKLAFLDPDGLISTQPPPHASSLLVVLDASNLSRIGWSFDRASVRTIVNIDHHEDNTRFADFNAVDTHAAATGQILCNYFASQDIQFPPQVAQALYTAIMTDTGGFRFNNTNGEVLRICGDLLDAGADGASAYHRVYAARSVAGMRLLSAVWASLQFYDDGLICSMEMPISLIDTLGANYGDSEGLADLTINAEGVKVGMLIKYKDHETHFSLRSAGTFDVGRIARSVAGGGGHSNAAGCTVALPLDEAKSKVLAMIRADLTLG